MAFNIQGIKIDNINYSKFITRIRQYLKEGPCRSIGFINAHCINITRRDIQYKLTVNNFDLLLPDGIGISLAAMLKNAKIEENLNGTDLIPKMLGDLGSVSVFLLGARPSVLEKTGFFIEKNFPMASMVGLHHGYFSPQQEDQVISLIQRSKPDIILVALGVPFQEKFILRCMKRMDHGIFFGVGGLFDFMAGSNRRAPKWIHKLGFEWAYRISQEPGRLWRRYIIGNPKFLYFSLIEALNESCRKFKSCFRRSSS